MVVYAVVCNGYDPPEVYSLWFTEKQAVKCAESMDSENMPRVLEMEVQGVEDNREP